MHARITRYYLRAGASDEVIALMAEHWLPLIRESPGFRGFRVVQLRTDRGYAAAGDQLVTLLEHETPDQSLDALELAREWIFKNISHLLTRASETLMGDVLFAGGSDDPAPPTTA